MRCVVQGALRVSATEARDLAEIRGALITFGLSCAAPV